jgi:hypothetical protein
LRSVTAVFHLQRIWLAGTASASNGSVASGHLKLKKI